MNRSVPPSLEVPANERVLAYVKDLSAHDEATEALLAATKPLGDVQIFCPNPGAYRYLVASTKGVIFGFAAGMGTVAFRFDERMKSRALATAGLALPECGEEWVAVLHPRPDSDWPAVDLKFWALKSYFYVREQKKSAQ